MCVRLKALLVEPSKPEDLKKEHLSEDTVAESLRLSPFCMLYLCWSACCSFHDTHVQFAKSATCFRQASWQGILAWLHRVVPQALHPKALWIVNLKDFCDHYCNTLQIITTWK